MLGLTVLATILAAYEFQLAPLLPLLLPYLHLSHVGYGAFITFAVLISGISAFFGGPLADRYGRVLLIDICLGAVTVLTFANLLITGIVSFVIICAAMGIVGGLMAGAGAALVRDMSPRLAARWHSGCSRSDRSARTSSPTRSPARRCRSITPGNRRSGSWACSVS